jgi:uroporphyrinogen-III synthase
LIEIGPPVDERDVLALAEARLHWAQWDALMFVSSAAVRWFFDGGFPPSSGAKACRFWAPGPGTAKALQPIVERLGLPVDRIDAPPADAQQFDSESLWPVVQNQLGVGKRVLVIRGTSSDLPLGSSVSAQPGQGRDWLIRQCETSGALVQTCVAYTRQSPAWTPSMREQALCASAPGSAWLLSSSESLTHLQTALPGTSWAAASALATHPRIAAAARDFGFGEVHESRPALPDVLRALESQWSPI